MKTTRPDDDEPLAELPARSPSTTDSALRWLSQSANKGRLWLGLAAIAAAAPGDTRRAAVRGVGSLSATSALVNLTLKPLFRRQRPAIEHTPLVRRLRRQPLSRSFPSGHAASAAAFVTGVALEKPGLGLALAPLAATVAYSRVHVGVHHVSDVVAGAAFGAGIALAAHRWWPARLEGPAHIRTTVHAPALPAGKGLLVAVNHNSGSDGDPSGDIRRLLPEARLVPMSPGLDLDAVVAGHDGADDVVALGVAGGDGTVAAVAAIAHKLGLPLAVFPCGTLNHFARDVGVGTMDHTRAAVETGEAGTVDVASVAGTVFVNTSSLGGYPAMVRRRVRLEGRLGRWPAMAIATARTLRGQRPMRLHVDGVPTDLWVLFVGNGRYVPRGALPAWRPRMDDGLLDIQYLRAGPFARTRAAIAILTGTAGRSRVYRTWAASSLTVTSPAGPVEYACDGESVGWSTTLEYSKLPRALVVYRPVDGPLPAR